MLRVLSVFVRLAKLEDVILRIDVPKLVAFVGIACLEHTRYPFKQTLSTGDDKTRPG